MSAATKGTRDGPSLGALWLRNLVVWAALLVLLLVSWATAYWRIGSALNTALGLGIAAVKAGLVLVLFMQLRGSSVLVRLTASAGLFWLVILFGMTFADVLPRLVGR